MFDIEVAPFAGAWIEITCARLLAVIGISSLPSRERGLKSTKTDNKTTTVVSLPSRERGLKLSGCCISKKSYRRSLRGSVDWNNPYCVTDWLLVSRSLRGSVDWNQNVRHRTFTQSSRSLRGSVDWNSINDNVFWGRTLSLPSRERGLKLLWWYRINKDG